MRTGSSTADRILVPLSFFVVAVVVVEAALSPVGFGTAGAPLALLASTVLYPLTAAAFFGLRPEAAARLAALGGMAASAIGLHVADPSGPVIGLFLVAALAPLAGRVVPATAILAAAVAGYNLVQLGLGGESLIITIATDAACAFFYFFGTLVRTERAQREAVSRLLHELEASRAAEREASRLAERAALAREIHDVLAHSMSGLVIQLSGARLLAGTLNADPQLIDALDNAHRQARSGLDEARRAVGMLRDGAAPDIKSIERLLHDHAEVTGTEVDWQEIGDRATVPAAVQLTVYRWAQETLSNVRKHAPHAVAHLHLHWAADALTLEAWNDLTVDPADIAASPGYGLVGMAERAHGLGGTFDIEHSATRFRTLVKLPLARTEELPR